MGLTFLLWGGRGDKLTNKNYYKSMGGIVGAIKRLIPGGPILSPGGDTPQIQVIGSPENLENRGMDFPGP